MKNNRTNSQKEILVNGFSLIELLHRNVRGPSSRKWNSDRR
jgi:hypothetical protein